jgi:small subunit ribosomal protein S4
LGRYTEARCKLCRREGTKLFLKGDRCYTDKCGYERRPYPPGIHGQNRTKFTEYGLQLREKQKVKRLYGLEEKQFSLFFKRAARMKGITGENLLSLLEKRLDNVIFKLGFAPSRQQARQLILHSHFTVNGKKVSIPSMVLKKGDEISIKEKSRKIASVMECIQNIGRKEIPQWLVADAQNFKGSVKENPVRSDIAMDLEERLIVELYSK